jgi:hypothetical protein
MARFLLAFLLTACGAAQGSLGATASDEGWAHLRESLVGTWETTTEEGRRFEVSYRMVSNDSALVETWGSSSGNQTLTVYHRDGERLVLTHYCAQGNQAHLVAVEADPSRVRFHRVSATNWNEEQSVLDELVLHVEPNLLERTDTYVDADGVTDTTVLRFTRVVDQEPAPAEPPAY